LKLLKTPLKDGVGILKRAEANRREITCGLPQNDICADASVGALALIDGGTIWHRQTALRSHYLAPFVIRAIKSLPIERLVAGNQLLAPGSGGGNASIST
jgi:hypothetical protein